MIERVEAGKRLFSEDQISLLEIVICLKNMQLPINGIKQYIDWVTENYPEVNVLVNNAGIQQRFNVLKADAKKNWDYFNKEITTNIEAPFHLSMLFAPFFATKEEATIINVTSGLAFTPFAIAPIYSATKAAVHSFTMSLRH